MNDKVWILITKHRGYSMTVYRRKKDAEDAKRMIEESEWAYIYDMIDIVEEEVH